MNGNELILATKTLLRDAEGRARNEQETAETAQQAQDGLNWWRLLRGVSPEEDRDPMVELHHDGISRPHSWQTSFVHMIAKLNGGWSRYDGCGKSARLFVTGRKHDVEIIVYLTTFVIREVERLAAPFSDAIAPEHTVSPRESFCLGAMQVIRRHMQHMRALFDAQHAAMTDVDLADRGSLNEFWKRNHGEEPTEVSLDSVRVDEAAYRAGREAGATVATDMKRGVR